MLLESGALVVVNKDLLAKTIFEHIVIKCLVERGDAFAVEYRPYVSDDLTLISLLT